MHAEKKAPDADQSADVCSVPLDTGMNEALSELLEILGVFDAMGLDRRLLSEDKL